MSHRGSPQLKYIQMQAGLMHRGSGHSDVGSDGFSPNFSLLRRCQCRRYFFFFSTDMRKNLFLNRTVLYREEPRLQGISVGNFVYSFSISLDEKDYHVTREHRDFFSRNRRERDFGINRISIFVNFVTKREASC